MYHLLKAMHFRQYCQKKSKPPFNVLAAILKLSTKYIVDELREEVINTLSAIFSSRLTAWIDHSVRYTPADLDAMYSVELAKKFEVPIILPAAYYQAVSQLSIRTMMRPDSSMASNSIRWTCAVFREELMSMIYQLIDENNKGATIFSTRDKYNNWLCEADECYSLLDSYKCGTETKLRRLTCSDVFKPTLGLATDPDFCEAFRLRVDQHWRRLQDNSWNRLPSLCGFKDWAVVRTAQAALKSSNEQ
ncbi:hypothetical protein EWM64_g9168 [Hericium alpestre]|uniref:Uncharacterized protein n=1 Tax=Hericium alpestre TaxID=135208 RepID=A0A4Y9ZK63_9AGAM|nr:hypothetical protein EWM64_g9168 [Hericium alpestre]